MSSHAHNATVRTASVEIKMVTVDNKKMPLNVFRQLLKEDAIDRQTGKLNGNAWGFVNYFWNDCGGGSSKHLHVIWQKGNELRRDCVTQISPFCSYPGFSEAFLEEALYQALLVSVLHHLVTDSVSAWPVTGRQATIKIGDHNYAVDLTELGPPFSYYWHDVTDGKGDCPGSEHIKAAAKPLLASSIAAFNSEAQEFCWQPKLNQHITNDEIYSQLNTLRSNLLAAQRRSASIGAWAQSYKSILGLGQLFITV